jgi:mRNA interferase MazF
MTLSTTSCEFGDVVLIAFPFTNLQTTKKRPAVIINSAAYSARRPDFILFAVPSRITPSLGFGECLINDWQQAGLLKLSAFKPVIATLEQGKVL